MLKKVVITNYLGESMEYRIDGVEAENPSGLIITSIDGLGPVKANINMTDLTTTDGQMYNSARLSGRNIVIKALFTHATSIEEARLLSYKYFPVKKKLKFRIETDNRIGETEGYVESNEPDIFSEQSGCQISILCENPYFDGGKIGYTFGDTVPLFKFKFGNESLDEPLIKLSEEAEVSSVREIVYEGDTDAGMEIAVEAPSDDIMDTFKVTGIEIQGDKGSIKIDTSKMVSQVPNTSPTNSEISKCFFINDGINTKCLGILPFDDYMANGLSVVYHDNIHLLFSNKHYKYDGITWTFIDNIPIDLLRYGDAVVHNDKIHLIGGNSGTPYTFPQHFCWDETNGWYTYDEQLPYHIHYRWSLVSYNGQIHTFGGSQNEISSEHYTWDETNGWQESDPIPGTRSNQGFAVAYNNKIYVSHSSTDSSPIGLLSIWNNSSWESTTHVRVVMPSSSSIMTVLQNEIHVFTTENAQSSNPDFRHYKYNDTNEWTYTNDTPVSFVLGTGCSWNNHIYLIGGAATSYYTEDPNNDHLIENDKLVINTIKGKKGVTLYRGTNKYNVLNSLDRDSTWLQLQRGVNRFSYSATEGADDMQITISTNKWYEGV